MSIFKTVGFTEIFNGYNTPAAGLDRYGLPIKSLMLQLNTNDLYILDEKNNIIPLSTRYASIAAYATLSAEVEKVKENIDSAFHYRGILSAVTQTGRQAIPHIIQLKPDAKVGDTYMNAHHSWYVCIGTKEWEMLGNNISGSYDPMALTGTFLAKGHTIAQLSSYIAIEDWSKLVSICEGGVKTALDKIIAQYQNPYMTTMDSLVSCLTSTHVQAVQAYAKAYSNYDLIKLISANLYTVSCDLYNHILTAVTPAISSAVEDIASTYLAKNSVSKNDFNTLSGSYDNFVSNVLTRNKDIDESLSALQTGLDGVNGNLNQIYEKL